MHDKYYLERFFMYLKGAIEVLDDEKTRQYIGRLLGLQGIPRDSYKAHDLFWQKIRKLRRLYKEKCRYVCNEKTIMDCIYHYKENKIAEYVKSPILSLMRGIVVRYYWEWMDEYTRLVRRAELKAIPFAKFFNIGEFNIIGEEEPEKIDVVLEKLDGTLIILWYDDIEKKLKANTRGNFEINNPYVDAFWKVVEENNYYREIEKLVDYGSYTVMFELVGATPASAEALKHTDKVLGGRDYKIYLLARRDNATMELEYPVKLRVSIPKPRSFEINDINKLIDEVNKWDASEGVVIYSRGDRYGDGFFKWWDKLVKVKSWRYTMKIQLGLASTDEINERVLTKYVVLGYLDDLIPILNTEQLEKARKIADLYSELEHEWEQFIVYMRQHIDTETWKIHEPVKNRLKANCRGGWLIPYIIEAVKKNRVEAMARKIAIINAPRKNAVSYMQRLTERLRTIRQCVTE
mgnify:CR=1 FL=1